MKTIEATIRVRVQVATDLSLPDGELKDTARQAVENALRLGEDTGFEHPLAAQTSVGVCAVELEQMPRHRAPARKKKGNQ